MNEKINQWLAFIDDNNREAIKLAEKIEIAKKLLKMGMSIEQVEDATQLSKE